VKAGATSGLALFAALAALFGGLALLLPEHLYGDDVFFVHCIVSGAPFSAHFLFMPIARGAANALARAGLDPFATLRLLAALGTAAGAALLFAAARRRGASALEAALLALLSASAASTVFFATTAEIHGLHFAAVGLLAWTLARLGPTSRAPAALSVGLAAGLVVGTHQSGILFLPAAAAFYLAATPGKARADRLRDLGAFAAAAVLVGLARAGALALETGHAFGAGSLASRYWKAFQGRLAGGWGVGDALDYVSRDAVAPAPGLALLGAFSIGLLLRRRPVLGGILALAVLPHTVFFALFDYHERGAYFVATLPALAAAVLVAARSEDAERPHPLGTLVFVAGVVLAGISPDVLAARAGGPWLAAAAGASFLVGLVLGRSWQPAGYALGLLLFLLAAQTVGSARMLVDRARTPDPVLAAGRDACLEADGRDALVVTASFAEEHLLFLLREPWPEPLAGTWRAMEGLPLPGPAVYVYGDPNVPPEEVLAALRERVAAARPVYVSSSVREFLSAQPRHAALLRAIEAEFELRPVERRDFRAEELHPRGR